MKEHFKRVALAALLFCPVNASFAAMISGVVTDETGLSLEGVQVKLTSKAATVGRLGSQIVPTVFKTELVTSAPGGRFEMTGVPNGLYSLCVSPNDRSHVDSCVSRKNITNVEVADGDIASLNLSAQTGTIVELTLTPASVGSDLPANAVLVADSGAFYQMNIGKGLGKFWVVVPSFSVWRLETSSLGGRVGLPTESIRVGAPDQPVNVAFLR